MIKSVCIVGLGGVGGYFASKIAELQKHHCIKLYGLARGAHLQKIRQNGLIVHRESQSRTCTFDRVSDSLHDLPLADLYIIAVKAYDLKAILKSLQAKIEAHTIVIPLLNGVDITTRIRSELSIGIVLRACVYVGTHISEPGVIVQNGGDGKILWGNDTLHTESDAIDLVQQFFADTHITNEYSPDPCAQIWAKYLFICTFGIVCSAYGASLGDVLKEKYDELKKVAEEVYLVAKAEGIVLPETIVDETIQKGKQFTYETKPSVLHDIERKGNLNEIDLFSGTVLKLAHKHKMKAPEIERLSELIKNN